MHKIVFSKTALSNLIDQAKYIYEQSQSTELADKYLNKMKSFIVAILSQFPESGRPSEELAKGTRKLVYKGYSIIYRVGLNQIDILLIYKENIPKL